MRFDRMSGLDAEQLDALEQRVSDLLEKPWAVSIGHGDTMLRNQLFEGLDRLSPVERLAWSAI